MSKINIELYSMNRENPKARKPELHRNVRGESAPNGPESQEAAATPAGPVARPWRRMVRLSVRGLIVLVLALGASVGWLVRGARIQREAVAAITRAGGVRYSSGWTDGSYDPGVKPLRPGWPVDLVGVDYFAHVTDVRLFASSPSIDEAILQVGRLGRVERLTIHQFAANYARVAHLKGLTNVSDLALEVILCTDADLAQLTELTNLSKLDLGTTEVTDVGLADLGRLTKLSELGLLATPVTDAGLVHLKSLTTLSKLDLSGTRVSDAGLRHLKGLTNLRELLLYSTQVTRAGLKEIKQALPNVAVGGYGLVDAAARRGQFSAAPAGALSTSH
jgi:hypothetical protein